MKRMVEALVFCGLAAMFHLALMVRPAAEGAEAAGVGGTALASLQASNAQLEQIVTDWERPPEIKTNLETITPVKPVSDTPPVETSQPDLAVVKTAAVALPSMDAPLVSPTPEVDVTPPPKPVTPPKAKPAPPKPETSKVAQRESVGQKELRASGSGGGPAAGKTGQASAASLSAAKRNSLIQAWGGEIRTRIGRHKRPPRGERGSAMVVVRVTVSPDGTVRSASIAKSSGSAAFDQAALQAVSRAGRMPRAPKELTDATYSFNQPMNFK